MDRKGFLFVVAVFLILTYILLSISVWVKAIETSERSYAEFYRQSTLDLTIAQITPEKVSNISNMAMNRAIFRLNQNAFNNEILTGPTDDQYRNIRLATYSMFLNGTASSSYFSGSAPSDDRSSSIQNWVDGLNQSLLGIGLRVSNFSISDFKLNQSSMDAVDYSFNMTLRLGDFANTSSVSRVYHVVGKVDLNGLVDPALVRSSSRLSMDGSSAIYRQFFFYRAYQNVSSFSSSSVISSSSSIYGGQGWLYNQIASAGASTNPAVPSASSLSDDQKPNYILVGTFDEINRLGDNPVSGYPAYAGYILTSTPTLTRSTSRCSSLPNDESNTFNPLRYQDDCSATISCASGICTDKPFIVSNGFSVSSAGNCPVYGSSGSPVAGKCVLIQNNASASDVADHPQQKLLTSSSGIFNIENMRDLVMCGYYIGNPNAPSYLDRLLSDPYSRTSLLGIETFIIGQYANASTYNGQGHLDREFFGPGGPAHGINVRGLPGCRDAATCGDSPVTGIFAVSPSTATDYGLNQITCDRGAHCG